jgi:glycosyltransferase involved in cell wall biosynthesis
LALLLVPTNSILCNCGSGGAVAFNDSLVERATLRNVSPTVPMRILLVAYFYEAPAGGAIIVARLLREQLEARAHTVDILCLGVGPEPQGGKVWRLELPRWTRRHCDRIRQTFLFLNNGGFDRFLLSQARSLPLAEQGYQFVLAQDFLGIRLAHALAEELKIPCGATLHDTLPQQVSVGAPTPILRRVLARLGTLRDRSLARDFHRFAWLAAVSRHVEISARRWLQPHPPPLHVIYNPAPKAFFRLPPPPGGPELSFLFVGRLSPEKGVDLLVEAFRRVPGGHRLTVLGLAGSLMTAIAKEAASDSRVQLRPPVPYAHMPEVYASHDVVCCPVTWDEPFGLTVLEGRISGRVVIGTPRGGLPEILAGYPRALLFDTSGKTRDEQIAQLSRALLEAPRRLQQPLAAVEEARFLQPFRLSVFADHYQEVIAAAVCARG